MKNAEIFFVNGLGVVLHAATACDKCVFLEVINRAHVSLDDLFHSQNKD